MTQSPVDSEGTTLRYHGTRDENLLLMDQSTDTENRDEELGLDL